MPNVIELTPVAGVKYVEVSSDHVFAAVFFRSPEVPAKAAIASRSASHAWTLVPIVTPSVVRWAEALVPLTSDAPAAVIVTLPALISSVLSASPVAIESVLLTVKLDDGTILSVFDASESLTRRPVLASTTLVISVLAPDAAAPTVVLAAEALAAV